MEKEEKTFICSVCGTSEKVVKYSKKKEFSICPQGWWVERDEKGEVKISCPDC